MQVKMSVAYKGDRITHEVYTRLISGTSYLTVTLRGEKVTLENLKLIVDDKIVQLKSLSIEQCILYETYILVYQSDRSLNLCWTVSDKI